MSMYTYVHLCHHVHGLQQVFREVALFKEERVEAVMQIIAKIIHRVDYRQHILDYVLMVV